MKVNVEKSIPVVECIRKFLYVTHVKYREVFGVKLENYGRGSRRREPSRLDFEPYRYQPNRSWAIFTKRKCGRDLEAGKRLLRDPHLR
jgi:hypothetical protein